MHLLSARAVHDVLAGLGDAGKEDHRILDGYGAIPSALAEGLDLRLNQRAHGVRWNGDGVRVELERGEPVHGDVAIVTIPVGVLRSGRVRFDPVLPADKLDALRGLPMGPVIKLVYVFDEPVTDPAVMALFAGERPPMWWSPTHGRAAFADGPQVWTAFVSGAMAIDLLERGEEGALAEGLAALSRELGRPLPRPRASRLVGWPDDPDALGGYSVVLAGHDGARERLAAPTPPLFWAGEATEPEARAATVHGAYLAGLRAAAEAIAQHSDTRSSPPTLTARGTERPHSRS